MVSVRASPAFFLVPSLAPESNVKSANMLGFVHKGAYTRGLKLNASMQDLLGNGLHNRFYEEQVARFAEEQMARFVSGTYLPDPNSHIHRQYFTIRSYEIGPNGTVTLETLMNLLQESGMNCVKGVGIEVDGLALTPDMRRGNIIWVMRKVHVKIDRYPTSGDFVEVDNWSAMLRKGIRRDSLIRDCKTGNILLQASSYWVFMNKETRRLADFPDDLREISGPYLTDSKPIIKDENIEVPIPDKTTPPYCLHGLKPRWGDLDNNQHVNNAKYIGWILETVRLPILKKYELCSITMKYKKECHMDSLVRSITDIVSSDETHIKYSHLLKLEDGVENGPEIMKAMTTWRLK